MKYAFFDLDGTLHDKHATLKSVSNHLFQLFELEKQCDYQIFENRFITENEIIQPKTEAFDNITNMLNLSIDSKILLNEFDLSFHLFCKRFDGVLETLTLLKEKGFIIGCITNGRDFFQRNKINGLGIEHFFSIIVTSGELDIRKPDHAIFYHALNAVGAKPNDSFYCGDSIPSDIVPAKEIGCTTIYKCLNQHLCESADYTFIHYSTFPNILEKLTNR